MLTAKQVLDEYFLDTRSMLLEIAATLDRRDAACARAPGEAGAGDPRLEKVYRSLAILADEQAGPGRVEQLLRLFSDPVD
jgi:hypothetical protein